MSNVNLRLNAEEVAAARAQAKQEEQRAGVPVSMSAVIRRAIRRDLLEDSVQTPRAPLES